MNPRLEQIAETIIKALHEEGFTIHRYDSFTTNSIYLKLDWGANNSIRISDHPGKQHLAYRFNIGTYIPDREMTEHPEKGYPQYWFPEDMVDKLIYKVISSREEKLIDRGETYYLNQMAYHRKRSKTTSGFWHSAKKVSTGRLEKKLKPDKKYDFTPKSDTPKPKMDGYMGRGLPLC